MIDLYVYKILAYPDELVTTPSSYEEFQQFLTGVGRPDFGDRNVICIKFAFSIVPNNLDDAQEMPWFINPNAVKVPPYCVTDNYGGQLPSEFPPYLMLRAAEYTNTDILDAYCNFLEDNIDHDYRENYAESFKAFTLWAKSKLKRE